MATIEQSTGTARCPLGHEWTARLEVRRVPEPWRPGSRKRWRHVHDYQPATCPECGHRCTRYVPSGGGR